MEPAFPDGRENICENVQEALSGVEEAFEKLQPAAKGGKVVWEGGSGQCIAVALASGASR